MDYQKELIVDYNKIVILQEKASTTPTTINLMHLRHEVLQPQVNAFFLSFATGTSGNTYVRK